MAIARAGSASLSLDGPVSVYTRAYTCGAGSNRALVVGFFGNVTGADEVTSVTYAGVAMTRIGTARADGGDRPIYFYGLLTPATGANNVVVTFSISQDGVAALAADYTDVAAFGTGVSDVRSGDNAGITITPSAAASTDWVACYVRDTAAGTVTYTGVTQIQAQFGFYLADSNAPVGASGPYTVITVNGGHEAIVAVPFSATAVPSTPAKIIFQHA